MELPHVGFGQRAWSTKSCETVALLVGVGELSCRQKNEVRRMTQELILLPACQMSLRLLWLNSDEPVFRHFHLTNPDHWNSTPNGCILVSRFTADACRSMLGGEIERPADAASYLLDRLSTAL